MKLRLSQFLIITSISLMLNAQDYKKKDSIQNLDEIIINTNYIFGNKYVAKNRTGASYYISPKELKKYEKNSFIIRFK